VSLLKESSERLVDGKIIEERLAEGRLIDLSLDSGVQVLIFRVYIKPVPPVSGEKNI
jgi:hypothetical protein